MAWKNPTQSESRIRRAQFVVEEHQASVVHGDHQDRPSLIDGDMSRYETPEQVRFDV